MISKIVIEKNSLLERQLEFLEQGIQKMNEKITEQVTELN